MALSGTFSKTVRTGWKLQAEWSATQNISDNKTTVTMKLYWMSLGSSYIINSSTSKSGYTSVDGTKDTFTATAGLSGNQKKLLNTQTKTITHRADGTQDLDLAGQFYPNVSLSGTNPGTITISKSYTLNAIPRASSLSTSASWTAGNNLSLTISRASTSFTHTVKIYVNGTLIKSKTGVSTSYKAEFTDAENEAIFKELNGAASKSTKIEVITYNGSTQVGSDSTTGTVSAPAASKVTTTASFNIGNAVPITIDRTNSAFQHTVKIYVNGTRIKTITGVGTSTTWNPTSSEITAMYLQATNTNSVSSEIEVTTLIGDTVVRSATSKTGKASVVNSNPKFSAGFTFRDTNTVATGITGNTGTDPAIIQNVSTVEVQLPATAFAQPLNEATIVQYVATLNGVVVTVNNPFASPIKFNMGKVTTSSNVTLSVKAIDSRGNSTTASKTITVLPYSSPVVNSSVTRLNNFENQTTLRLSGSISSLDGKNAVQETQYRYKESDGSFSAWKSITRTTSGAKYTAVNVVLDLDNTKSFVFEVKTTDKLSSTTVVKTITAGQPIFFIDKVLNSLGVNCFPISNWYGNLQVSGGIRINSGYLNIGPYDSTYGTGLATFFYKGNAAEMPTLFLRGRGPVKEDPFYPIKLKVEGKLEADDFAPTRINMPSNQYAEAAPLNMNNSDIIGVNKIYINDLVETDSEAMHWPRSTTDTSELRDPSKWDSFRITNGTGYLNSVAAFTSDKPLLYSGSGIFMQASQSITPTKNINDCPTGWILCWSNYENGVAENSNYQFSYLPKAHSSAGGYKLGLMSGTSPMYKYIYVKDNGATLGGHDHNRETDLEKKVVLRYIYAF